MSLAGEVRLYIGAGSNIAPEENLCQAWQALRARYGEGRASPVYRSPAQGFSGPPFLNCVFELATRDSANDVVAFLEELQRRAGRRRGSERFASRTLDLDLLLYGAAVIPEAPVKVPREDIIRYAFVLRPLADLAPELRHPVSGRRMRELWAELRNSQPLEPVDLDLDAA